jgi:hypothetical protein
MGRLTAVLLGFSALAVGVIQMAKGFARVGGLGAISRRWALLCGGIPCHHFPFIAPRQLRRQWRLRVRQSAQRVTKRQWHAQMLAAFNGARTQAGAQGGLLAGDTWLTILHDCP